MLYTKSLFTVPFLKNIVSNIYIYIYIYIFLGSVYIVMLPRSLTQVAPLLIGI
jgi:hypothetical protein